MRLGAPLLVAVLSASSATWVLAEDPRDDHAKAARGHAAKPGRNDEVARRAQQMNGGGRVLSVENVDGGHRVKLLKNGEVRVVVVPE